MGEFFLNQLKTTNRFTKLHALVGVARRIFKGAHRSTVVGEGYQETFVVELFFYAVKAVTFATEHVSLVQFHIVKGDFTAAIHTQTELLKFGHFDSWFAHIDKPFGVDRFVRRSAVARHHHDIWGVGATGNKTLTTIKINLTISTGISRFQATHIGTSARFGNR